MSGRRGHASPADAAAAAEWTAFRRYRTLLGEIGAEDEAGLAVWASHRLGRRASSALSTLAQVTVIDLESPTRAMWRVLDHAVRRARSIRVTLGFEARDEAGSAYEANAATRDRLVGSLGFVESALESDIWRPAGLRGVEAVMFREGPPRADAATSGRLAVHQGLTIRGAPQGEGVARVLASEVRDRLDAGAEAEDILVVFRQWGEQSEVAVDTLRDWGIPVSAEPRRPLGSDPAVAALLLAIGLPADEWSTDRVIRLLRNGRIQPGGPGTDPLSMAAAASVIRTSPVFRGRESLLGWLDRTVANATGSTVKAERARLARDLVERTFRLLEPIDRPRPFADQVDRLFGLARSLGIGEPAAVGSVEEPASPSRADHSAGLDRLRDALEDRAGVLVRLGRGDVPLSWADFAADVESLAAELTVPPAPARPGSVRLATVNEIDGARAAHVLLADLAEGTFPGREAVEGFLSLRPGAPADADGRRAFSREMLRFLRVVGAAGRIARIDLPDDRPEGAGPAARRVPRRVDGAPRAVGAGRLPPLGPSARARARQLARARRLAGRPAGPSGGPGANPGRVPAAGGPAGARRPPTPAGRHRRRLEGPRARLRGTPFGEYDGLLNDGHVVLDVAELFPPEYLFSASQLETYIDCPFLFFCKYVLKLEPAERRDEIDEDYTERGSRIHDILETLERLKREVPSRRTSRSSSGRPSRRCCVPSRSMPPRSTLGLAEIDRRRLVQTVLRYRFQYQPVRAGRPAAPAESRIGSRSASARIARTTRGWRSARARGPSGSRARSTASTSSTGRKGPGSA